MNILYKSTGAALEYMPGKGYSVRGPYVGCVHGCKYCYVPKTQRKKKADFHAQAKPKEGFIDKFIHDARLLKKRHDQGPVFFSFSCDPYPPIEAERLLTRTALGVCTRYGLSPILLTKGALAGQDLDALRLCPEPWLGVTLTTLDPDRAKLWEPNAATPAQRLAIIERAKLLGLRVWISLEPVIYPAHSLEIMRSLCGLVDHFGLGKLNKMSLGEVRAVDPEITGRPDWAGYLADAVGLLERRGYQESLINCPDAPVNTFYVKAALREAAAGVRR